MKKSEKNSESCMPITHLQAAAKREEATRQVTTKREEATGSHKEKRRQVAKRE